MSRDSCVFCQIINGESPAHIYWEDDKHLAFLSIYPNTLGTTVVIPKLHHASYAFDSPDKVLSELVLAAKRVAAILDATLEGVGRTAMIFEGYGVDHLHAKLFPMHGTGNDSQFSRISSGIDIYFDQYKGYISSHDGQRADDHQLASLAARLRSFV